ncbi:MAG: histidinol dehydrogenase [Firmicutes bacterium]|nr:histidinol dehydrogenase [Bacillota bacterium]
MKIRIWNETSSAEKSFVLRRAELDITQYAELAQSVSEDVREQGDNAMCKYTEKFDGVTLKKEDIKITQKEIDEGYCRLDDKTKNAIEYAAGNIKKFHAQQMPSQMWFTQIDNGLMAGEKITPIADVCLYVPRGKGSFPSVLLMLGIPAVVAGVEKIYITTPPNEQGNIDDTLLAAAKITGITEIYKVGGIQAVAAAAFGTDTIPKAHKIIGPGNAYVTAAKRVLSSYIDTSLPAGPSEAIILCDEKADPFKAALDWMIEAEHGPDSASLLVTHSKKLAEKVASIAKKQLLKLPQKRREFIETNFDTYGGVIITGSLDESIDFVNEYAPEHMEIMTENPFDILPKIKNAGEILLGEHTPITLCNFLLGPNAILPTGGFAKTYSSVSVFDFLKRSSIGYATKEGFEAVREKAGIIARAEGFSAHALAVEER